MKKSKETYEKVGCACSEYKKASSSTKVYNRAGESNMARPTCLTCSHFKNEHCELDLYDKIASRLDN